MSPDLSMVKGERGGDTQGTIARFACARCMLPPARGAPPSTHARRVPVVVEEEHGLVDILRHQPRVHPEQGRLELARLDLVRVRVRVRRGTGTGSDSGSDSGGGFGVGSRFELARIDVATVVVVEDREDGQRDLHGA
eukprot:scaffold44086_cov63-Phaeocystis_antarctica.AAC.12